MTHRFASELTLGSFEALRNGEITAIILDDVATPAECASAARKIKILTSSSSYLWSKDFSILGVSIGEAHESEELLDKYLTVSPSVTRTARDVVFDGVTPIDRVSAAMMSLWAPGLRFPSHAGRPFLGQVLRRWSTGGGANPHIDQSNTALLSPFKIQRRFGINVYVEMPTEGGAVEFWNRTMTDDEYMTKKRKDYGLDRAFLGVPDLSIRPKVGQAILFDASKPHAVEPVKGSGERITNAAFYAVETAATPLYQFA